ncbi:MAG: hypothetical protein P1V51_08225 [Deltaproteobacteria bacterium]|nr:hypothetical protein [Deltaproteobacteria bacterium]
MSVRTLVLLVLGSCLVAAGLFLFSSDEPKTPEEAISAVLDEMVQATREQDLGGIMEHVSESFKGRGMTRDQLKGMLFVQLRQGRWTQVLLTERQITLESSTQADVQTKALLARGETIVPASADSIELDFGFTLEGEDWKLVRADWRH